MARIHTMASSRKPHKCENCGDTIPIGRGYRYFQVGFRSSYKHVRCLKPGCMPRPSQLTNSKVSAILAAQESASGALQALTGSVGELDDIKSIVEDVATSIEEVRNEYQEALDGWPNGNSTLEEKVETLDSAYDALSQFDFDDSDKPACDEHEEWTDWCDACESTADIWWSDRIQDAQDAIDMVELP